MNFREKVINVVQHIPQGKVTTYGNIAIMVGLPRGARFVGGVLHFNSDSLDLPWQRVVNRFGYISTNCIDHPKQAQKAILESEGVEVSNDFIVDLKKYGWWGDE